MKPGDRALTKLDETVTIIRITKRGEFRLGKVWELVTVRYPDGRIAIHDGKDLTYVGRSEP